MVKIGHFDPLRGQFWTKNEVLRTGGLENGPFWSKMGHFDPLRGSFCLKMVPKWGGGFDMVKFDDPEGSKVVNLTLLGGQKGVKFGNLTRILGILGSGRPKDGHFDHFGPHLGVKYGPKWSF